MRMMIAIVRQITMNINFCEQNTTLLSLDERSKRIQEQSREREFSVEKLELGPMLEKPIRSPQRTCATNSLNDEEESREFDSRHSNRRLAAIFSLSKYRGGSTLTYVESRAHRFYDVTRDGAQGHKDESAIRVRIEKIDALVRRAVVG